ncbi:Xylose isomerase-like TIM barrel [Pseudobythopirellula maris]|uniref:Xylose isomerase-like TIM barrel n=1 Tax=Pseudobythopirellula maris TaxID=2527991 RepID=A0A5C5ZLB7_9BACT|nr:sugar phosphate isomerase/epimerase family protein [Pseudobythopirellula maris]TWT88189.1 Xylose isomerase-like TIM barrel [Pseudobythopirellula maris]
MPNLRIGLPTRSLRLPLRQALLKAAELGADGVEIDARNELRVADFSQTAVRQFRKTLSDLGLELAAVAFPTRRGYDDPSELDRRVLATQQAMTLAYKLGARTVVGRVGRIDEDGERRERLVGSLELLAAHGERVGARLAAQTGAESGAALRSLLEELPEQGVGVAFHPGELLLGGYDPQEALEELAPHITYVQAGDAVHDFAERRVVEVELGRGSVQAPELLGALEERGYDGWVTVDRREGQNPAGDLGDAIAYLRAL